MFALLAPTQLTVSSPLSLAIQSFLAGILVAPALLCILAYRPLRDRVLGLAGLFGLATSAAWVAFSGIAAAFLPAAIHPAIHPASLILGGLCLAIWERVASGLLDASPTAQHHAHLRQLTGTTTLAIALAACIPWAPSHRLSELLLGLLAPLLALLTLTAGLRAHREGLKTAPALIAVPLALLVCCACLWVLAAGGLDATASRVILQATLLVLAVALGAAMLSRMAELQAASEAAQAAQLATVARQAQDLEALVEERNLELSSRLADLGDARRAAELANEGLQRALEQLEQAASTDRLTGAWNRRRFEEAILPEIALAHRRNTPLSLLMLDLDHFKRVNDAYGHSTGDAVLAGMSQTVRLHLRASDALVRWGGEEFLVMAPATRMEGALGLAEKLRAAVADIPFPGVGNVTMSLGVAEYAPGETLAQWIERADQALYRAKSEGRNRTVAAPAPEHLLDEFPGERSLLEVIWEEAYESGHSLMDAQHQRLFRLANTLMAVLTENRPLPEVALRLETLLAHTAQHFHDEEQLLREAHYQDLGAHAGIHAELLRKARQLQAEVQAGQLDFGKLVTFLTVDLVKGHLLTEDQHYFSFLHHAGDAQGPLPSGA